jgi:uncharacterized NAD-dependent epimerase/dehydratase family protein
LQKGQKMTEDWKTNVENQLDEGKNRISTLEKELEKNTELTQKVHENTADLIATFDSVKGAFRTLEMLGSLAKPLTYIVACAGAIAGLWYTIKGGAK